MGHTYASCFFHVIFSTKGRRPVISKGIRESLFPYIAGIARKNGFLALEIGGAEDHVHILLSLSAVIPVFKAVQLLKGGSSKWLREKFPQLGDFTWQEGYGAFSVSISQIPNITKYIRNQMEHHRKITFKDEFIKFLEKHEIVWDDKYIWS
jgi:REP element-mobilizing transposase RayT